MPYDWNTLGEVFCDLHSGLGPTLEETFETANKRSGLSTRQDTPNIVPNVDWTPLTMDSRNNMVKEKQKEQRCSKVDHKARCRDRGCGVATPSAASVGSESASLSTADSRSFRGDSSLGPRSNPPVHMTNDDTKNGECLHQSATEGHSQVPHMRMTHSQWKRHLAAKVAETEGLGGSKPIETEGLEGTELMETSGAQRQLESEPDKAMSGEQKELSKQKTVLHQDMSLRQAQKSFRIASVDSLLRELQNGKSRREAYGIQHKGQNEDLERGKRVLEAWKRKSETGFSVEINFVTKTFGNQEVSAQSLAKVLQGIGVCHDLDINAIENPVEIDIEDEHYSEQIIHDLGLDLIQKAQNRRLLLVCSISHISLLDKALLKLPPSWQRSRISGLLVLDCADLTPSCVRGGRDHHFENDKGQRQNGFGPGGIDTQSQQQALYQSCTLPLTRALAQSIQIHILPSGKQTGLINHSCPVVSWLPSLSNTLRVGRRERDIWCHAEEYQDCVSWSILDLLEGDNVSCLALSPTTQPLNALEELDSQSFLSAYLAPNTFDQKNTERPSFILNALRWVAFSFQPLSFDELFTALASKPASSKVKPSDVDRDKVMLNTADELVNLCLGLLRAGEKGFVEFCDPRVKDLILKTEISFLNPCKPSKVHEMIAAACMDHLRCLHPQSLFRPWILTNLLLTTEVECCRLRHYSTTFWHEHFRIAQDDSECLSLMLDEAIQSAIIQPGAHQTPLGAFQELRINLGLWICCLHDFHNLGKTYLQMGAHVRLHYPLNRSLLHIAAANSSPNMLKHLLEAGADSKSLDAGGQDVFQYGARSVSSDIISILINHEAITNNEVADRRTSECRCPARVGNGSVAISFSRACASPDLPLPSSEPIVLDDANCVEHMLGLGTDQIMADDVSDSILQPEIGDGRSSAIISPFQGEESALLGSDISQDDWVLIDKKNSSCVT